jgi:hypothetical protein
VGSPARRPRRSRRRRPFPPFPALPPFPPVSSAATVSSGCSIASPGSGVKESSFSSESSSSRQARGDRRRAGRRFSRPMSTKAALMPGRTASTRLKCSNGTPVVGRSTAVRLNDRPRELPRGFPLASVDENLALTRNLDRVPPKPGSLNSRVGPHWSSKWDSAGRDSAGQPKEKRRLRKRRGGPAGTT